MDPVTIFTLAAAAMEIAFKSFEAGQALGVFINDTKNIDQTLAAMASEIKALGSACNLIGTRIKSIAEAIDGNNIEKGGESPLWLQVRSQLDDCGETVNALAEALVGLGKEKKKNPFAQAWRQIQLNMKAKDIDEARNRIRSHTASLQLVLQAITLEVSYLGPHKADQQLILLLENIRDIKQELTEMRQSAQAADASDVEKRHDQKEGLLIEYTDKIISSGETLYEQSVAGGSVIGASEGLNDKITSWVSRLQALSTEDPETEPSDFDTLVGSSVSGAEHGPSTDITSDSGLDVRRPTPTGSEDGLDEEGEEDDLQVEMIKEAYSLGVADFELKEYDKANELLQEVLTMVEESPVRSSRMVDVRQLRWMLAVCAYHTSDYQTAEVALKEIVQIPPQSQEDRVRLCDAGHILALASLKQDKLNEARQYCDSALQGRRRLLGKQDPACYESLALLARIFQLQDNGARAAIYSKMIPEEQRESICSEFKDLGSPSKASLAAEKELPPVPAGPPPYVPEATSSAAQSPAVTPSADLAPEKRWKFRPPIPTQPPPEIIKQEEEPHSDDEPPAFDSMSSMVSDIISGTTDEKTLVCTQTSDLSATRPPIPRTSTQRADQYKQILALREELSKAKKKTSKKSNMFHIALGAYADAVLSFDLTDPEAKKLHEDVLKQAKGVVDDKDLLMYKTYNNLGKIADINGDVNAASDMYQKAQNSKRGPGDDTALRTAVEGQLAEAYAKNEQTSKPPDMREQLRARRRCEAEDRIRKIKEARKALKRGLGTPPSATQPYSPYG